MKFTAAALAILCANDASVNGFSPSFVPRKGQMLGASTFVQKPTTSLTKMSVATPASAASMSMLVESSGGMEELYELTETADAKPLSKRVRKSPAFFKIAGIATIPISAALGFGIVPSRRIVAHGVGAVITGIAGAVGKSRLDALTESNAKPAIAQALIDAGLEDPETAKSAVEKVRSDFGILDEDFADLCVSIYSTYLMGMVKYSPTAKTSEIKELQSLKTALSLDNLQVGEAHHQAAVDWYRQTCLFTPEEELDDPDHPDRQAMDKFLFLSERALANETPQAFTFEMTRISKAFNLEYSEGTERVTETAEPFYQRALKSTRAKLGTNQVSSSMLERARTTLGVSDAAAADMHVASFNEHVRELLGLGESAEDVDLDKLKFPENALEELGQLREILGMTEIDANYEISLEATPLFQSTALAAMEGVVEGKKSPDEAWEVMEERRGELLLNEDSSKNLMKSMVMQALGGPLERTNKFAKVNNEAATYDNLLEALEAKEALISILTKSGWDEFEAFDETFCNPWDKQSANGFLLSDERIKLYRIFLTRSIRKSPDGVLSDETYDEIKQVQGLLGITDMQAEIEARGAFGPNLQKVLDTAMTEIVSDYTEELASNMQKKVDDVMTNYRLTEDFLKELGATFYAKAVALVSESAPGGIPTPELFAALEAIRKLGKIEKEDTYPPHMEYFGSVYKKSVLEAMGTTGVIRPEFRGPLDDLQSRLGVSEADCKNLFLEAIEEKMVPMVEWVGSEMERTMLSQKQLSQRRKKGMGEDVFQTGKGADGVLGLGAEVNVMSDIMELVDFYQENEVAYEDDEGEMVYPVTALGTNALDQELAELLYRQFVVGGFTTQGEKGERYEAARETFGGILGLETFKKDEIKNNIASTVYDNLVSNSLKTKGSMDQQDMMFLANIQTKLGLSSEDGEKMLMQAQKKVLSEEVNELMDAPTPEGIKAFRERCNTMGVDLAEDVGISSQRLARMFESEITPALKSGTITVDSGDILGEIQESMGIEAEECERMFESLVLTLAKNAMDLINSELLRGRDENAVDLIKELVRYAQFLDGELGLSVEESMANQVANIYEALDFADEDPEDVSANLDLLRTALGLSS